MIRVVRPEGARVHSQGRKSLVDQWRRIPPSPAPAGATDVEENRELRSPLPGLIIDFGFAFSCSRGLRPWLWTLAPSGRTIDPDNDL